MDFIFYTLSPASILTILLIIGGIIAIYYKKLTFTLGLILLNAVIFILTLVTWPTTIIELGFRPIYLTAEYLPQLYTMITSMFLHSGFLHLLGNMITLFFIGLALEQRIGWKNYFIVYILGGIGAVLIHSLIYMGDPAHQSIPLVGASGAIFAVMGAIAYSYTNDTIVMPIPLGFIAIVRPIRAIYAVGLFAALETFFALQDSMDSTAHFAHLGGLIAGVLIAVLLIGKNGSRIKSTIRTGKSQTRYYNPYNQPSYDHINYNTLRQFATTPQLNSQLNRIQTETVDQVRDIWLQDYFEKIRCPTCGRPLQHHNRRLSCPQGHIDVKY